MNGVVKPPFCRTPSEKRSTAGRPLRRRNVPLPCPWLSERLPLWWAEGPDLRCTEGGREGCRPVLLCPLFNIKRVGERVSAHRDGQSAVNRKGEWGRGRREEGGRKKGRKGA